jgi:hypothetical protein
MSSVGRERWREEKVMLSFKAGNQFRLYTAGTIHGDEMDDGELLGALPCLDTTSTDAINSAWSDPATGPGLMWTKADNGVDVTWQDAMGYCRDLHEASHSDWRLATIDELHRIYDSKANVQGYWGKDYGNDRSVVTEHVKGGLKLSGDEWSSSTRDFGEASYPGAPVPAWFFRFSDGTRDSRPFAVLNEKRALCVRASGA